MEELGSYAAVTSIISLFKPPVMVILKSFTKKIIDEEVRGATNLLMAIGLGTVIAFMTTWLGGYAMTHMETFLIGTGLSFGTSQMTYAGAKLMNKGNKVRNLIK